MSQSAGVAITMVLGILVVANILGNSIVCWIIKKNRDMRTHINYLLVNLAVADIMYAVFISPYIVSSLSFTLPDGLTGTVLCKLLLAGNIAWFGAASSVATLTVIAVERYYAAVYPFSNTGKRLTKRNVKVIIPSSWIFALVIMFPQFATMDTVKEGRYCVDSWPKQWMGEYYSMSWLVVVVLSCTIMVVLYSRVVYTLWFKPNNSDELSCQQRGVRRVRKRVTLMVVAVSAIYGICWFTDTVENVLMYFTSYSSGPVQETITKTAVLFSSAVNPYLYALINKQFRDKIKGMVCRVSRVHPIQDLRNIELACIPVPPTAGQCSRK